MFLKEYIPPIISIEEVHLESGISNGSVEITPGNEQGIILIDEWIEGGQEQSTEGDSRW